MKLNEAKGFKVFSTFHSSLKLCQSFHTSCKHNVFVIARFTFVFYCVILITTLKIKNNSDAYFKLYSHLVHAAFHT